MVFAEEITKPASSTTKIDRASRFISKQAQACRKCDGGEFWVNRSGGLECVVCSPPTDSANQPRLEIEFGVWRLITPESEYRKQTRELSERCRIVYELFGPCDVWFAQNDDGGWHRSRNGIDFMPVASSPTIDAEFDLSIDDLEI